MKKNLVTIAILSVIAALVISLKWDLAGIETDVTTLDSGQARIVTMAPSTGEVVFALGLGDQVVGVSRFATYPPEVADKVKIGGYLDVDMEALLSLRADVVVVLKEQQELAERLQQMAINSIIVDHMSIEGIKDSIRLLGEKFNKQNEAIKLLETMQSRINTVDKMNSSEQSAPSMLLSIGRELGEGKVSGLVAAGSAGVHQELLEMAGYSNAYKGRENFPQLTKEHIIRLDPKFIVDLVSTKDAASIGVGKVRSDWDDCVELQAVLDGRVHVLVGDQHFVPGPRFCDTLEWLALLRVETKNE